MTELGEKLVTVRRTIPASRSFLFAAWTDPALFAQWFGPRSWRVERCEVDPRVDGRWRAWFRRDDGGEVYAGGTYLEVDPPSRLVFTWDIDPAGSVPDSLSVVTLTLAASDRGTEIEISHRKLGAAQATNMDAGWNNTLDALEDFVSMRPMTPQEGDFS